MKVMQCYCYSKKLLSRLVFVCAATQERNIIISALLTFHESTCIRFVWRTDQVNYLYFFSGEG